VLPVGRVNNEWPKPNESVLVLVLPVRVCVRVSVHQLCDRPHLTQFRQSPHYIRAVPALLAYYYPFPVPETR